MAPELQLPPEIFHRSDHAVHGGNVPIGGNQNFHSKPRFLCMCILRTREGKFFRRRKNFSPVLLYYRISNNNTVNTACQDPRPLFSWQRNQNTRFSEKGSYKKGTILELLCYFQGSFASGKEFTTQICPSPFQNLTDLKESKQAPPAEKSKPTGPKPRGARSIGPQSGASPCASLTKPQHPRPPSLVPRLSRSPVFPRRSPAQRVRRGEEEGMKQSGVFGISRKRSGRNFFRRRCGCRSGRSGRRPGRKSGRTWPAFPPCRGRTAPRCRD